MSSYPFEASNGERTLRLVLYGLIAVLAVWLGRRWYQATFPPSLLNPQATPRTITPRGELDSEEQNTVEMFERVAPSVVHVRTLVAQQAPMVARVVGIAEGTGSGVVWDKEGHIVTNFHVIAQLADGRPGQCIVVLSGRHYEARLVGADRNSDVAVLKIRAPASELVPIPLGQSSTLRVGQKVYAIGNPFGLDGTLTSGIISALGRDVGAISEGRQWVLFDMIQTDAAINPGNSGGPLLDSAGRLIGLNTATRAAAQNIGFAVPSDTVNGVATEIIRRGQFRHGVLGIILVPDERAKNANIREGVVVLRVDENSPAERAGIRGLFQQPDGSLVIGDIVLEINGKPVNSGAEFEAQLSRYRAGVTIELTILRKGQRIKLPVELVSPEDEAAAIPRDSDRRQVDRAARAVAE